MIIWLNLKNKSKMTKSICKKFTTQNNLIKCQILIKFFEGWGLEKSNLAFSIGKNLIFKGRHY